MRPLERSRRRLALLISLSLRSQTSRVEDGVRIYHLEMYRRDIQNLLKKNFFLRYEIYIFKRTRRFASEINRRQKGREIDEERKIVFQGSSLKMADGDNNKCKRKKG